MFGALMVDAKLEWWLIPWVATNILFGAFGIAHNASQRFSGLKERRLLSALGLALVASSWFASAMERGLSGLEVIGLIPMSIAILAIILLSPSRQ